MNWVRKMKAKKSDILLDLLLLALLSIAAYATSFQGAYQFDDFRCIVLNESLKGGSLSAVMRFSPGRFLVFLTFFLDQKFFPGSDEKHIFLVFCSLHSGSSFNPDLQLCH